MLEQKKIFISRIELVSCVLNEKYFYCVIYSVKKIRHLYYYSRYLDYVKYK
jgi:hypothetical protein